MFFLDDCWWELFKSLEMIYCHEFMFICYRISRIWSCILVNMKELRSVENKTHRVCMMFEFSRFNTDMLTVLLKPLFQHSCGFWLQTSEFCSWCLNWIFLSYIRSIFGTSPSVIMLKSSSNNYLWFFKVWVSMRALEVQIVLSWESWVLVDYESAELGIYDGIWCMEM